MEKQKTKTDNKNTAKARAFAEILKEKYPDALCSLNTEGNPWKMLIMGRLSAQCTDERVNTVCLSLFEKYGDATALAQAPLDEIENIIRPCGLFRTKAVSIKNISRILCEKYSGKVPDSMEELLLLPGVGRKIANLVLGDAYNKGGIVADTHCIRICARLGFYPEEEKNPKKTEKVMEKLIPRSEQSDFCHRIVHFGRDVCCARNPKCHSCPAAGICARNSRESSIKKERSGGKNLNTAECKI